jgi:aminoglycoside phosphotransferase family enzyme
MSATPAAVSDLEWPHARLGDLDVQVRENTGIVFLVGDKAYKAKKSLFTAFLDFSTPESRDLACANEVALNRRQRLSDSSRTTARSRS